MTTERFTAEVLKNMTPAEIVAEIASLEGIIYGSAPRPEGFRKLQALNDVEALKAALR